MCVRVSVCRGVGECVFVPEGDTECWCKREQEREKRSRNVEN